MDDDMVIPESTLEAVAAQGKGHLAFYMYRTCQSQCEVREAIKYGV